MAHGIPSVESRPNSTVNVETEKVHVHVEAQGNDQETLHVETHTDVPVVSPVHVETPDTEQVEPNKTQSNVHTTSELPMQLPRTAKLVLKPLNDLDIDVWCSKTSEYHQFLPSVDNSENLNHTGYSLCDRKPKGTSREDKTISISLSKTNSVDYAPMLDSASDDSDVPKRNTSNKIRPKLDSPSTAMLCAHAQIQNNKEKNFETKPVPVLHVIQVKLNQMWKHPSLWK